ncbi:MAG: DNA ligase [Candidatus Buchananbacteria bacterium]|nr:DNA ligase [Candidatus Buchananbacteria bacterium]
MGVLTLKEYQKKRDFKLTPEPKKSKASKKYQNIFVIQKHDATNLHYDFRIEIGGVLVSWAVPKGPSTNPQEKRLAIRTENHPLEYVDFEGIIPEDQYGAGTVIVWDQGKYKNQRDIEMSKALAEGKIEIWLKGKKIQGGYNLIKTGKNKQGKEQWLLMKANDKKADARRNPTSTEQKSVKSNKTIKQIRQEYEQDSQKS